MMNARAFARCSAACMATMLLLLTPVVLNAQEVSVILDREHGLSWLASPLALAGSAASEGLVMPRARALAVLAAANAAGEKDTSAESWRLATSRELLLLSRLGEAERRLAGADLAVLRAWLAASSEADGRPRRGAVGDLVLFWPVKGSAIAPGFAEVAVFATNSVRLKNRATVSTGDVVVNDASPGPTLLDGYELALDPFAATTAGSSLAADSVRIKNNAKVAGDVSYNNLTNQGSISGALLTPLALPVFASLPAFVVSPPAPGSPDVSVSAGGAATLPPGDYGAVSIGHNGKLILSAGIYNLSSLTGANSSEVLFAGPAEVRIAGRLAMGSSSNLGPEDGSGVAAHDLVLYVAGINGDDGALGSTPLAAELGTSNVVTANLYVPNGTLRLGQKSIATGAFLGRDVLIENQATVALDSAFFNRAPEAQDDAATVDESGTTSLLDSGASSVLANDSDPNGDPLTVTTTPVHSPDHGILALNSDGTFTYTHDGGETTADSFIYEVCDDGTPPLCATATVTITIVPVNDPPTAVPDATSVLTGGSVSVLDSGETSLLANDFDPEGGALSVTTTPVSGPAHGTVSLNADGTFTYTHDGSDSTTDGFVYEACDDGTPTACDTAAVTVTISGLSHVTIIPFGTGTGRVVSVPAGIDCGSSCEADFAPPTPIQLQAVADPGSQFAGFSGHADCADGLLTPDGDKVCFARFNLLAATATLSVALDGSGSGLVISDPAGIFCPGACSASYPIPTRVELTAEAAAGSAFVGWSGDPDCEDGSVDLFAAVNCTATFMALPPPPSTYALTLIFLGSGSGQVSSNPSGLICESNCAATFAQGTSVTLLARPFDGVISGWGGDCSGTDFFTTVLLDSNKTCTVTFDL